MRTKFLLLLIMTSVAAASQAQYASKSTKTRFNHLAQMVSDLKKSTTFYRDFMGLDTIPEPFHDGKHTWFQVSEHGHLHLIEGTRKPVQIKEAHLCFSVASVPDFIGKLRKAGIPFENWAGEKGAVTNRADGVKQVYLQDPDGYWLEVNDDH